MGLIDSITGNSKPPIDHYELHRKGPTTGGWATPDFEHNLPDLASLGEPLDQEGVVNTAESEGWPSGTYKLVGRREDGTLTSALWEFDHESKQQQREELTPEERRERRLARIEEKLDDGRRRINEPGDLYGETAERILNGEDVGQEQMEAIASFAETWENQTREPPSDPGEFAAKLANAHMSMGDVEAAAAILDRWFEQSQTDQDESLVEIASNSNLGATSMDDVKTLGILKFLEDPKSLTREVTGGLLEAGQEVEAAGQQRQTDTHGAFTDLAKAGGFGDGDQEDSADRERSADVDERDRDRSADVDVEAEPDVASRGADLGVVGDAGDDDDEQAVESAPEAAESEATVEDAPEAPVDDNLPEREPGATDGDESDGAEVEADVDAGDQEDDDGDEDEEPKYPDPATPSGVDALMWKGVVSVCARHDINATELGAEGAREALKAELFEDHERDVDAGDQDDDRDRDLDDVERELDREGDEGDLPNAQTAMKQMEQAADGGEQA